MSAFDILAAFEREQAEEVERDAEIRRQLAGDTHQSAPATTSKARPASGQPRSASRPASGSSASTAAAGSSVTASAASSVASLLREDAFELRPLLWSTVAASMNPSEHQEVRRMLGEKQLEENEALDQEIRTLLSIVTEAQIRHTAAKFAAQASSHSAAASSTTATAASPSPSPPLSRTALPSLSSRSFLSHSIHSLLLSLKEHGRRSGILGEGEEGLEKVLPRPETARQRKVMQEVVHGLTRDSSVGTVEPSTASPPTSAPTSRPTTHSSQRPISARPSTARQRSLSTNSSVASLSPGSTARETTAIVSPEAIAALSATFQETVPLRSSSLQSSSAASSNSPSESARLREDALAALRRALADERVDLLQDITYLQACLEEEVEQTLESERSELEEKRRTSSSSSSELKKPRGGSAPAGSSSVIHDPSDSTPISVQELRELNESLKQAVVLEEQRTHTLNIMQAVSNAQERASPSLPVSVRPGSVPSGSVPRDAAFQAARASGHSTPLKVKRVASAAKRNGTADGSPVSSPLPSPDNSSPFAAAIAASSSVVNQPSSIHDLLADNADLFSDGPSAAAAVEKQARPEIPSLALGKLSSAASGESKEQVDGHALNGSNSSSSLFTPSPPSSSPMTARTASKVRSRIQAAQQFTESADYHE